MTKTAIEKALKDCGRLVKADNQKRRDLIQIFGEVKVPQCVPGLLLEIIKSSERPADADSLDQCVAAVSGRNHRHRGHRASIRICQTIYEVPPRHLVSIRKPWAIEFLSAIDAGKIDKAAVSIETARKMTVYSDSNITGLIAKHFGSISGATTAEMKLIINSHAKKLQMSKEEPDRYAGEKLFQKNCGKCHILFGEGGKIGPDLTAFKRDDVQRMLVNIVNPSAEIREGFETFLIVTEDGRTVNGFLADQDNNVVVIRSADGQSITVERNNIDEMLPQKKSLMPEGLLDKLSEKEVRDLFSYLRSSQPLP